MSVVSEEAVNVPAVARRLGLTRQSVQRVVNELTSAGLVSLESNPDHERSPLVTLTEEGRRVMGDLFQRSEASRTALLNRSGLSADKLHDARRVVRALLASFDDE